MKFTNTKTTCKAIGKDAKDLAKASVSLVRDTVKLPFSFGKDLSAEVKLYQKAKKAIASETAEN